MLRTVNAAVGGRPTCIAATLRDDEQRQM